jgi:hypothetical protein
MNMTDIDQKLKKEMITMAPELEKMLHGRGFVLFVSTEQRMNYISNFPKKEDIVEAMREFLDVNDK